MDKDLEPNRQDLTPLALVGSLFVGIFLGLVTHQVVAGMFFGLGVGFMAMALFGDK